VEQEQSKRKARAKQEPRKSKAMKRTRTLSVPYAKPGLNAEDVSSTDLLRSIWLHRGRSVRILAPPEVNSARPGSIGVHLGISRAHLDINWACPRSIGVHFWSHMGPLGCTSAFEDFNLGAQRSIGVHVGTSRDQFGCIGLVRGVLWYFKTSIWVLRGRWGRTLAPREFNWGRQGAPQELNHFR